MNQTDTNGISAVTAVLLAMNEVFGQSLNDLDRVEIQIVQEQLARIIHRNGHYVAKQEDETYRVVGGGEQYHPHSQREQLFRSITDLADLEQTHCYCDNQCRLVKRNCVL